MINGTKLLNVAGMTRGRRDGILKSEKVRHVVKIGPMHLKGVWYVCFDYCETIDMSCAKTYSGSLTNGPSTSPTRRRSQKVFILFLCTILVLCSITQQISPVRPKSWLLRNVGNRSQGSRCGHLPPACPLFNIKLTLWDCQVLNHRCPRTIWGAPRSTEPRPSPPLRRAPRVSCRTWATQTVTIGKDRV